MLLNIRDVMTLSGPRDVTQPNSWSLDPSFDGPYAYDLGGMNELTFGHTDSVYVIGTPDADHNGSSNAKVASGSGAGSYTGNEATSQSRRARGEKLKARGDEEFGADAATFEGLRLGGPREGVSGTSSIDRDPIYA